MNKNLNLIIVLCLVFFIALLVARCDNFEAGATAPPTATPTRLPLQDIYFPIFEVDNTRLCLHVHYFRLSIQIFDIDDFVNCYVRAYPFEINPFAADFIPMVHCNHQLADWNYDYAGPVLVINEPGLQCDLTPAEGAALLAEFNQMCPDCYVVVGNMVQDWGKYWFEEFLTHNPDFDAIGFHYYIMGDLGSLEGFQAELNYYSQYDYPIWVTEFGTDDHCNVQPMVNMMSDIDFMIYFGPYTPVDSEIWPSETRLFDDAGELTNIGLALFKGLNCEE